MNTREQQNVLSTPHSLARMRGAVLQRYSHLSPNKGKKGIPAVALEVLRSTGQPLSQDSRKFMETRFRRNFSGVRIHTDSRATHSARSIDAEAYTAGQHIVFDSRHYTPGTAHGRKLLAHELVHTIQQGETGALPGSHLQISPPSSTTEQEADSVAKNIASGALAQHTFSPARAAIQRQTAGSETEKKPEKTEAGEVIVKGLKTVAEQAKDNNPKVKKFILEPLEAEAKKRWNLLGTGEKALTIGFGAGTVGMTLGTLLADPNGRKVLEDVNLAAPLSLIPYMPLDSFKFKLPSPEKQQLSFTTGFKADDLINLYTAPRGLPKMSLSVTMHWNYDPATDRLSIAGGNASLGLVPGLSISGGVYKDILRQPPTYIGAAGQMTQIKQVIPEPGKPKPIPDVRVMITVDLMKFKPGDLVKQIGAFF